MISGLVTVDDRVKRGAGPHRLARELRVRMEIPADIDGLPLHREELLRDGIFGTTKSLGERCKPLFKGRIIVLSGKRLSPKERQVIMTSTVVQLA